MRQACLQANKLSNSVCDVEMPRVLASTKLALHRDNQGTVGWSMVNLILVGHVSSGLLGSNFFRRLALLELHLLLTNASSPVLVSRIETARSMLLHQCAPLDSLLPLTSPHIS